jgi:hypothetical protein
VGRKLLLSVLSAALVATAALIVSGCGSSQGLDPVAKAAETTGKVPGYKIAATINVGTPQGQSQLTMSGTFDRANRSGTITAQEAVAGHQLAFTEVFSGLTFYLKSGGFAALKQLTGGKPWLKFDMSRLLGALGVGSLPTAGTDPTQFVDFLRAVSSSTTKLGTATVRGVSTTHYRATVDLDKYPTLLPKADQAGATRSVATLEKTLGAHTLPMEAWIGKDNLVRRIGLQLSECVSNQRIRFGMTMDLYGYGPQQQPQLPASAETYDLTPLLTSALSKIKTGCTAG